MKEPFDEARVSERRDPLDARSCEFDWDALAALLQEPAEGERGHSEPDLQHLAIVLRRIFGWLTADAATPSRHLDRLIGRRALAMVWSVRPDIIQENPSLASLAKRIGVTRAALSWHAADFSREFRIKNRSQIAHGSAWNRGSKSPENDPPPGGRKSSGTGTYGGSTSSPQNPHEFPSGDSGNPT